ncbi:MAG: VacJ family lipoprotein [Alphaproteobacteria bacterium]|nr:VacJ family lipoprotein [Alphaproteobacteria bacterium]
MSLREIERTQRGLVRGLQAIVVAVTIISLAACASTKNQTPEAAAEAAAINDPIEDVNRAVFEVNRTLDETLMKPIAIMYRGVVPEFGRERIANALDNLGEPVTFFNDLLQGEFERAGISFARFVMNSTLGFFGAFDVAAEGAGLEKHKEDFGQTLGVWGLGEGPYLMLPLFGPSNPRDVVGLVADIFMDPFTYVFGTATRNARFAASAVSTRSKYIEELEALEKTSVDFYAAMRNLYREKRNADIRNGTLLAGEPMPSVDIDE